MRLVDADVCGHIVPLTRTNILPFRPAQPSDPTRDREDKYRANGLAPIHPDDLFRLAQEPDFRKVSALWPQYLLEWNMLG